MEALTLAELDARSASFDAAVLVTDGIDHFCSASDWILPAARALMPAREAWIRRGDHGWAAFACDDHPAGLRLLLPLEASWGLASPLAGADADALVEELDEELERETGWDLLLVPGVARESGVARALLRVLGRRHEVRLGDETVRCVADLRDGADVFLSRRSRNLRRTIARAARDAEAEGIRFERCDVGGGAQVSATCDRILAVEARSWKGQVGTGMLVPEMREFYRAMVPRLARRGGLRLLFARAGGRDVGYILGGVLDGVYRGLQFSFDSDCERIGLGNLAQWMQIRALAAEGIAVYDLGTDREYKRRWSDSLFATLTLLFVRGRRAGDIRR